MCRIVLGVGGYVKSHTTVCSQKKLMTGVTLHLFAVFYVFMHLAQRVVTVNDLRDNRKFIVVLFKHTTWADDVFIIEHINHFPCPNLATVKRMSGNSSERHYLGIYTFFVLKM